MKANQWTPLADRFWPRVHKGDGCWVWAGPVYRPGGYGRLRLAGRSAKAHRIAWTLANGPIPPGGHILHHCDNPPCVKTEPDERFPDGHLYLGHDRENARDRESRGRGNHRTSRIGRGRHAIGDRHWTHTHPEKLTRGEAVHTARLTETDVLAIRERRAAGATLQALAAEYGVTFSNIARAASGETWGHLPGAVPKSGSASGDQHYRRR